MKVTVHGNLRTKGAPTWKVRDWIHTGLCTQSNFFFFIFKCMLLQNLEPQLSIADGDCSHEIKRHLLLGRKVMTHLDSILKNRDITLSTKVCLVKTMVFPVVMYGCESWTIKKGAAAAKSLQSCPTLCNPIDGSPQVPPSLGFSKQEHWSGLPFPSPMHESEKWKWSRSDRKSVV